MRPHLSRRHRPERLEARHLAVLSIREDDRSDNEARCAAQLGAVDAVEEGVGRADRAGEGHGIGMRRHQERLLVCSTLPSAGPWSSTPTATTVRCRIGLFAVAVVGGAATPIPTSGTAST
jgi:hypothetical protein